MIEVVEVLNDSVEVIEVVDNSLVESIEVEVDQPSIIEVVESGPQGPKGDQGEVGPVGPSPDLSSPPPIGDVTPNTGKFTSLEATSDITTDWIHNANQSGEITFSDAGSGYIDINAGSGAGDINLLANNVYGEDIQAQKFSLDTTAGAVAGIGELAWNDHEGTLDLGLKGGNTTLQIGQENVLRVKNDDVVTLTDGMVVYVSGANGTNLLVKRAEANAESTSASTIGVVTETISVNGHGYITTFGVVRGLNTNSFNAGDILYLSPTSLGELTATKPSAPNHMVMIGFVVKKSTGSGEVFVSVQNGYELEELHDVSISSASAGQVIRRNAGNTLWENQTLTASDVGAAPSDLGTLYDGALSQTGAIMYDGTLQIFGSNGSSSLNTDNLTSAHSHYFPNSTGTLALISDIPTTFAASAITSGTLDNARVNWASPGAIGSTTAAAGTFTTLIASKLTANNGTLTASAPVLDLSQTWNNSGVTFTGLKFNVTDTNSASGSLLMDLQVGGASKFNVNKSGAIYSGTSLCLIGSQCGIWQDVAGVQSWLFGSKNFNSSDMTAALYTRSNTGTHVPSVNYIGWSSQQGNIRDNAADTMLYRDGFAGIIAQRNGTNAQEFRLYNTYTSSTNYERGFLKWNSNVLQFGTERGNGGGAARALEFYTDGTARATLGATGNFGIGTQSPANLLDVVSASAGAVRISVTNSNAAGECVQQAVNNSGKISLTGIYGTSKGAYGGIAAGDSFLYGNGNAVTIAADGAFIRFCTGGSPSTEKARLTEAGLLAFGGGTTSSYPALKRSTTSLQVRLADDSAFTNVQGKLTTHANAATETVTCDKTLTLYDAAGTAYKVPCVAA